MIIKRMISMLQNVCYWKINDKKVKIIIKIQKILLVEKVNNCFLKIVTSGWNYSEVEQSIMKNVSECKKWRGLIQNIFTRNTSIISQNYYDNVRM